MAKRRWMIGVMLCVASCSNGAGGADEVEALPEPIRTSTTQAPTTTAAPTTTTTVPVDQIPEEITVEYVDRVMDALDQSWGDMYRLYKESGGPTPETQAWLEALYDEPAFSSHQASLGREAGDFFDSTLPVPGVPLTSIVELYTAAPDCIFARAQRSLEEVLNVQTTDEEELSFLGLSRKPAQRGATGRNGTAWMIFLDGRTTVDGTDPVNPCE